MSNTVVPLVLIPGLLCDADLFAPQLGVLSGQRSVSIFHHGARNSMAALAADLLAIAPPRFAICGLSMGGYVALEVARQAPERLVGLALIDTNADADSAEGRAKRAAGIAKAQAGEFEQVVTALVPNLVHADHLRGPAGASMFAMARRNGPGIYVRQQTAIMHRRSQQDILPGLNIPALVMWGAQDALSSPEVHRVMADKLPNCAAVEIPHCGHLSTLEAPDAATATLQRWLSECDA